MSNSHRVVQRLSGAVAVLLLACGGPAAGQTAPKPAAPRAAAKPPAKPAAAQKPAPKPAANPAPRPVRKPAPATPKISESGVLEQHELLSIAALGMKPSSDPFRNSPTAKYQGRDFVLYQTLRQSDDTEYEETNGRWEYDKAGGTLRFALPNVSEFDIYYKETTIGRFTAQNAFGARWPAVHKQLWKIVVDTAYHSSEPFAVKAAPEEARSLTTSVYLKVEGRHAHKADI